MKMIHPYKISVAAVIYVIGVSACKQPGTEQQIPSTSGNIRFVASYPIKVAEPSGLTMDGDGQSLWTVSDDDGSVHHIDLKGRTLSRFQTEHEDLEGIADINSEQLAYIKERGRLIVISGKDGQTIRQAPIPILGSDNKGPEGLCYDGDAAEFHILQERPGRLITLNADLHETARRQLNFAQDYSSISFDSKRKHFWVLSDQSESIHVLDQKLGMIQSFSINVKQMEGMAIDHGARRIYIISDPLAELFVFEFDAF